MLSGDGLTTGLLASAVIFMIFVAPWLGQHLSWALFVISILIILATLAMLFATALVNPGFLPRDLDSSEEDLEWGCALLCRPRQS